MRPSKLYLLIVLTEHLSKICDDLVSLRGSVATAAISAALIRMRDCFAEFTQSFRVGLAMTGERLFLFLLILFPFPVTAESFRQVGDEFIEIVVMESDAIIEADLETIGNTRVRAILMDIGTLSSDVSHGTAISRLNIPAYTVPMFDGIDPGARILDRFSNDKISRYPDRLLLFIQGSEAKTMERFGFTEKDVWPSQAQAAASATSSARQIKPFFAFGKYGHYFYGNMDERSRRETTFGDTILVVQDFEASAESLSILAEQSRAVLSVVSASKSEVTLFPIRRVPVPEQERSWTGLLSRLKKAIQKRRQFFRAEHYLTGAEQVEVLIKTVLDENVYSNYALEAIRGLERKEIEVKLIDTLPKLTVYLDDAVQVLIDRRLRRIEKSGLSKLEEYLQRIKKQVEGVCHSRAGVGQQLEAVFVPTDKNLFPSGDMLLVPFPELNPLLAALYQAELQCFLKRKGLSEEHLQIDYEKRIGSEAQALLRSGSLTRDEIGLLETKINVSQEQFEKQQALLKDFRPVLMDGFFNQLRLVPWRLYELVDYCEQGIADYDNVALPDYRRGAFALWSKACADLTHYEYPRSKCVISDSRLKVRRDQFKQLLESGMIQALEHDDRHLLQLLLAVLRQNRTPEGGKILANVVQKSRSLRGEKLRQILIAELSDWPFYPLAYALAEEYSEVSMRERATIEKTLEKLTSYSFPPGLEEAETTKWKRFLEKSLPREGSGEERALGSPEAVRLSLEAAACDVQSHGWNKRFREVALKL